MAQLVLDIKFRADSSHLVGETRRARREIDTMGGKAQKTSRSFRDLGRQTGRTTTLTRRLTAENRTLGRSLVESGRGTRLLIGAMRALAGLAVIRLFVGLAKGAAEFGTKMKEVSTLLANDQEIPRLTRNVLEAAKAFGQAPVKQADALYKIISAGASNAAEATFLLNTANKLAIGGVTDVATAAFGLTSIMNAYGLSASRAEEVSDALFVGMKAGQTTITELSNAVGNAATFAAASGVSFEELIGSVASLTKVGINTSVAFNGVRAILTAISKPSEEARQLAEELGIEFGITAIQAKGLAAFLEDLVEKTGGSAEKITELFGSVEALTPVLALTGKAADDFSAVMSDMANKAGLTQEAFAKMADDATFKFARIKAAVIVLGIEFGNRILNLAVPAMDALLVNFNQVVRVIGAMTAAVGALVVVKLADVLITWASAAVTATRALLAAAKAQNLLTLLISRSGLGILLKLAVVLGAGALAYELLARRVEEQIEALEASLPVTDQAALSIEVLGQAADGAGEGMTRFKMSLDRQIVALVNQRLTLGQSAGAIARVAKEQELFNFLQDKGIKLTDAQSLATEQLLNDYEREVDRLEAAEQALREHNEELEESGQFMRDLSDAANRTFEDIAVGARTARDALRDLLQEMQRIILRALVFKPLEEFLGDFFGGFFGGGTKTEGAGTGKQPHGLLGHKGGIVGRDVFPTRSVPARVFAGAPHFAHGGFIGSGEVPAILHRGEGIFTPAQMRALGGNVNITINQSIDLRGADPGVFARAQEFKRQIREETVAAVFDLMDQGGRAAQISGRRRRA